MKNGTIIRIKLLWIVGILILDFSHGAVIEGSLRNSMRLEKHNRYPFRFPFRQAIRTATTTERAPSPPGSPTLSAQQKRFSPSSFSRRLLSALYGDDTTHGEHSGSTDEEHHFNPQSESDNHDQHVDSESPQQEAESHHHLAPKDQTDSVEHDDASFGENTGDESNRDSEDSARGPLGFHEENNERHSESTIFSRDSDGENSEDKDDQEHVATRESRSTDEESHYSEDSLPKRKPNMAANHADSGGKTEDGSGSNQMSVRIAKDEDGEKESDTSSTRPKRVSKKSNHNSSADGGEVSSNSQEVNSISADGTNTTHLSYMVFKMIKTYDIKSMVDIPCRNTLSWFPQLMHKIDFEVVGFKYYCVDSDSHSQDDIRRKFTDAGSPEFLHIRPEEAHLLPQTDLVFSWDGPQEWGVKRSWAFFTALREVRPTYLLITNNPKVSNRDSSRGAINLRKQPFHVS